MGSNNNNVVASQAVEIVPVWGKIDPSDAGTLARLVSAVSTGVDAETGRTIADLGAERFPERRAGDLPSPTDAFPYDPNLVPIVGPDGKYRNCRAIAMRGKSSGAIVGYFPCDKGKGFAAMLDTAKKLYGIVADSHAGNNEANTRAKLAKIEAREAKQAERAASGEADKPARGGKRKGAGRKPKSDATVTTEATTQA